MNSSLVFVPLATPMLIFCGLFLLAAISAILLKKIKFPYTIGLVIIGLLLGWLAKYSEFLAPIQGISLSHDLIMYVLLPLLVFEASINIKLSMLIKALVPVMMLAVVGVTLATMVVGFILHEFTPMTLASAMLFGALISATDPVAVIALFKEVKAPEKLSLLMDAESLMNDATAIVMFGIILSIIQTGTGVDAGTLFGAVWSFIVVFFGGISVGVVMALVWLALLKAARGMPYVHIALTTILALSSFIIADHVLDVSGVMAVIAAGLIIRTYGRKVMADRITLYYIEPYWEFVAFVANSFIFLLLGLSEDYLIHDVNHDLFYGKIILVAIGAVLLARALVVYGLLPISNRIMPSEAADKKTMAVMFWGGLRGVVPVALMLSVPESIPERGLIIELTLAVVLFSLLVQGTTIGWLMRKLGISNKRTTILP